MGRWMGLAALLLLGCDADTGAAPGDGGADAARSAEAGREDAAGRDASGRDASGGDAGGRRDARVADATAADGHVPPGPDAGRPDQGMKPDGSPSDAAPVDADARVADASQPVDASLPVDAMIPPTCGDGVVDEGEGCDDGNRVDTDACRNICQPARCGDGVIQAGVEGCDDGNPVDTDACRADCTPARCGDGVVQAGVEGCDDGNDVDTDACVACQPARCGDGFLQTGVEACDEGAGNRAACEPAFGETACRFCSLRCTREAGSAMWGFADAHLHQMSSLAFGGAFIQGEAYDGASPLGCEDPAQALHCCGARSGLCSGASCTQNGLEGHGTCGTNPVVAAVGEPLGHDPGGWPDFRGWPHWYSRAHQQAYSDWLERAWRGGLRLVSVLAVENRLLCGVAPSGRYDCDEDASIHRQLSEAVSFQAWVDRQDDGLENDTGWYRIVETPAEARAVIAQGRLAVVLGVEVGALFGCDQGNADCTPAYVDRKLDELHALGVRHVIPIHGVDNAFGGTAFFNDVYALANQVYNGRGFQSRDCAADGFRFAYGRDPAVAVIAEAMGIQTAVFEGLDGQCNTRGLTPLGRHLIEGLAARGMLVDVDHMSRRARDETIAMARDLGFPVFYSHAHTLPVYAGHERAERMMTCADFQAVNDTGGMVALIGGSDHGCDADPDAETCIHSVGPVAADCTNSSKTFAQELLFAVRQLGGTGVGIGTDFNGLARHTSPRFGPDACRLGAGADAERVAQDEATRVTYPVQLPGFEALNRQVTGNRTFDINTDGVAHIGLLPDFIQDLRNVGLADADIEPVFRSAEAYVRMWERARGERGLEGVPAALADGSCEARDRESLGLGVPGRCDQAGDCPAGERCIGGACQPRFQAGHLCVGDDECQSGTCRVGVCSDCQRHADCGADAWCDVSGVCVGKWEGGHLCLGAVECQSGQCTLGVCTDCRVHADCADGEWCDATSVCVGKWSAGHLCLSNIECQSGSCRAGVCSDCAGHGDCGAGAWCDATRVCVGKWNAGHACLGDVECKSGSCRLGFCAHCDADDECPCGQWCDAAGFCQPLWDNGHACLSDRECASGACVIGFCRECDAHADCGDGQWCDAAGFCQPEWGNGHACLGDVECGSGHCVLGFCRECGGHGDCGANRWCDAAGFCQNEWGNGHACLGDVECGSGHCVLGFCRECGGHGDCGADRWCDAAGFCQNEWGNGHACLGNVECASGHCVAAFCRECAQHGDCGANGWCDAGFSCQPKWGNGHACLTNVECQSGNCSLFFCRR
ncbi:MAG: membrane dipeptidase [bacterium]